jgi:hypothetical protein
VRERVAVQEEQRRAASAYAEVDPRSAGFYVPCLKTLKHGTQMNADENRMNADKTWRGFRAHFHDVRDRPGSLALPYPRSSGFYLRSSAFPLSA